MPKIPTYDQLGQRVKDVSPQIGLRADPGIVSSQLAAADFYAKAQDVAYEYYDADKKAEAKSSMSAAENELTLVLDDHNLKDTSTNAEDFDKIYTKKSNKYITEISNKYSLRANEQKVLIGRLHNLSAGKRQDGRNVAFNKQQARRGYNSAISMEANIRAMAVNLPGTPLHNQALKNNEELIADAFRHGTIKYLPHKNMDSLKLEVENKTYNIQINAASTVEEIDTIAADLKNSKLPIEKKLTLITRNNARKVEVEKAIVSNLVASTMYELDEENDQILVSDEERFSKVNEALKGIFPDESSQDKFDKLSNTEKAKVFAGLQAMKTNLQTEKTFQIKLKANKEDGHNNEIKKGLEEKGLYETGVNPKIIKDANFLGKDRDKIIESLLALNSKIVSGAYKDPEGLVVYAKIARKINTGEILSASTAFTLEGEAKPLDLYDRLTLGDKPGGIGFADFTRLESEIKASGTVAGKLAKEKINKLRETLIKTIDSGGLFKSFEGTVARRIYNFSKDLDRLIEIGLDKGISLDRLLEEKSSDYVMPESVLRSYILDENEKSEEVKAAIEAMYGKKVEPLVLPPVWDRTLYSTYEDYLKSDSFIAWRNSRHATLWMKEKGISKKDFEEEYGK
tara:strand:- start:4482 stop:6356 length:1875 start_codon:yes stop_codon:yes gene_type:complete